MLAQLLQPLEGYAWAFLIAVALISILIGMALEGLPAAVLFVPVVYPVAVKLGIHPIHFCIVLTASVGIGLFTPPLGLGLMVALRFANISVIQHMRFYWPYWVTLLIGLLIIILFPEISLFLPRSAGFIK
jgi:TRAP-type C4-dicarboxylate transport system permease large subunit